MSVLVIAEAPGVTAEQDKAMMEALNLEGDPPAGARARLAGPTETGWRIVSLWDSRGVVRRVSSRPADPRTGTGRTSCAQV